MISQPISSNRLTLRPFSLNDAPLVAKLAGDKRVSMTTLNIPHPYSLSAAQEWISSLAGQGSQRKSLVLAVEKTATGELIGAVSLVSIEGNKAEIGYWIGHPYWGNGYCTQAVKCLIEYVQISLGINHFFAEHLATNPASGKVMTKNGMRFLGSVLKNDRHGNEVQIETYELKSG
jgi:RimJ/RimL family protein N-acetyltransferase